MVASEGQSGMHDGWKRFLLVGGVIAAMAIAAAFVLAGGLEQQLVVACRWTARVSLILFALSYVVTGVSKKRAFGLAFAGSHFIHAIVFCTYLAVFDVERSLLSTVGGTIGYLVLTLLVVATFWQIRAASVIRRFGMIYLWLVFAVSYLGRVVENGDRRDEGWFGLIVLFAIPVLRVASPRLVRQTT